MTPKLFVPTVTAIRADGRIDIDGNLRLMDALIGAGIEGFLLLGSTGEFPYFKDNEEKKAYLAQAIAAAEGRAELLIGTGGIGMKETVELSNFVLQQGVKGAMIISEFYFNMQPADFYRYYATLASEIGGDVYIYNYPARTGNSIDAATVAQLAADFPNIRGIKDSVAEFDHTEQLLKTVLPVRPDFEIYSGFDHHFLLNRKLGGAGCISALANVAPGMWTSWVKAARTGDADAMEAGQKRIQQLFALYGLQSNPQKLMKEILVKEGLSIPTHCHFPYDHLDPGVLDKGMEILAADAHWLK